jgi:hypothetical protein
MQKLLIAIVGALALSSCTTFRIDPVTTDNVTVKYDRGRPIPTYADDTTEMAVLSEPRRTENMFKVTLKNKTDKTWRVSDTDFVVESSEDGKTWTAERVYPSQEFYERERSRYAAGVAIAIVGSSVLDQPDVVTTRTTRVWGAGGGVVIQQTRVYSEPGFRSAWLVEDYAYSGLSWLNALQENLFYVKDLGAQEEYFGLVFSEVLDAPYYRITLKRDGAKSPVVEFKRTKKKYNPFWPD